MAYMLSFTNTGKVYWLKSIRDSRWRQGTQKEKPIVISEHTNEEKITAILSVRDFNEIKGHYVMMATKYGTVKKTSMEDYSHPRNGGIIAIKLDEATMLIEVKETKRRRYHMLSTSKGMAIRFSEKDVRPMGRSTTRVRGIILDKGRRGNRNGHGEYGRQFPYCCANGYASVQWWKTTPAAPGWPRSDQYKGHRPPTAKWLLSGKWIVDDEIMLITKKGVINRQKVSEIRAIGRNTQGVRLLKLDDEDMLVS